jgi:hypothetical protein
MNYRINSFKAEYEFPPLAVLPTKPTREQIVIFENYLRKMEQMEIPANHHFAPGLYAREIFIPKGAFLTGAAHKTEHLIVFDGDIHVWTEGGMTRLTGHHTLVSKPGAKRVGYAFGDTWCTCFFHTDKTDIDAIEDELLENPDELQSRWLKLARVDNPALEVQS